MDVFSQSIFSKSFFNTTKFYLSPPYTAFKLVRLTDEEVEFVVAKDNKDYFKLIDEDEVRW